MNDEETVALIAGGHTFGKTHGAGPSENVGAGRGSRRPRGAGLRLEEQLRHRQRRDTITSGLEVTWTTTPTQWSNGFFQNLFGYEWELTKSPAGAQQWTPKDGAGDGTVPHAHDPSKKIAPVDAHHRSRAARRPGLRENLAPLPRESRSVRRRLRPRLVQAHAPRHGPARPLPRAGSARRRTHLAGPDSRRRSPADRRAGHRRAEGQDPRLRPHRLAARLHRLGLGLDLPRLRQARRRERRPHPPRAAEGLGSQPARAARPRARKRSKPSRATSTAAPTGGKKVSLADLIVLARLRRRREGREECRPRRHRPLHPGPHGRLAGADRRRILRRRSSPSPTASAIISKANTPCPPRRCSSTRRNSSRSPRPR